MKQFVIVISLIFICLYASAQTFSEIKLKSTETGKGKLKKAPKKIYIADFKIFYQIFFSIEEKEKGGMKAGMMKGDATAAVGMGLDGLNDDDLINNTNYLYKQTIERMKAAGYEIVTADQMAGIKEFKGWQRVKGGGLSDVQFKGYLMSTPTDFDYFIKGTKEDGREKQTFTDNSGKISFQGDNVTVVKINLVIPMAENGESYLSRAIDAGALGAKAVGQTAFKISDEMVIGKGSITVTTSCNFINSEAMSLPTSMMTYSLKESIEIDGVIEKTKVKAVAQAYVDLGTPVGMYKYFEVQNNTVKKLVPIKVDPAQYNKAVREGGDAFLNKCWGEFYSNAQ